jgi:outer membrane protein assembly factor BamB
MLNRRWMVLCLACGVLGAADANWPSFRGPEAMGVSAGRAPLNWNADGEKKNIRWKTPIPGLSHSSPIVWGDRLYVATAVASAGEAPLKVGLYGAGDPANDNGEQSWRVYCLDKKSGKILWDRESYKGVPKSKRHTKATHSNTTLATDGKRLIAFFGSEGLYAYSLDGKLLWKKEFGLLDMGPPGYDLQWGFASSPVLFEDKVVVQCDGRNQAFVAVLSATDGKELWRTDRKSLSQLSWATPAVVRAAGRTQIVLNAWPYIASYDFSTGKELWRLKSAGDITVPTPIFAHGLIYVTNAHGGPAPLYAIKPEASGDISLKDAATTSDGIIWSEPKNGAYMQTPLIVGDLLYSCSDRGVLKVYDAKSGKPVYQQRLGAGTTGFSSSPVAVGDRVYFTNEEGETYVIKAGPVFELLATNKLGEIAMATPAVSEGVLFFRTRGHVVAIGE